MKKILLIVSIIVAVMLLTGCGSSDTVTDGNTNGSNNVSSSDDKDTALKAEVGDKLKAPEKIAKVSELGSVTFVTRRDYGSTGNDISFEHTYSIESNSSKTAYLIDGVMLNGTFSRNIIALESENGRDTVYSGFFTSKSDYIKLTKDDSMDVHSVKMGFASNGIDYAEYLEIDEFVKCEDSKHLDRECFVYDIEFDREAPDETGDLQTQHVLAKVYVDCETGIWLKWEENGYTSEVIRIDNSSANIDRFIFTESVEEQIIYNDSDITITAKSLTYEYSVVAHTMDLTLELKNNSDSPKSIISKYFNVNGMYFGGSVVQISCDSGESKETTVSIPASALNYSAVDYIKEIEIDFTVAECEKEDDPENDSVYYREVSVISDGVGKCVVKTDCPEDYVQKIDTDGIKVIDTDDFSAVLIDTETDFSDSEKSIYLKFYMENGYDGQARMFVYFHMNGEQVGNRARMVIGKDGKGFNVASLYADEGDALYDALDTAESINITYHITVDDVKVYEQTEPVTVKLEK